MKSLTGRSEFVGSLRLLLLPLFAAALLLTACSKSAGGGDDPVPQGGGGVTSVSLSRNSLSLVAGVSETLTATVNPSGARDRNVTWTSDNPAVATVGTDGKVTATKKGIATITVRTSDGGYTADCDVEVTTVATLVTDVSLDKTTLTTEVGADVKLSATIAPSNAANRAVSWSSSNTTVARIDANGTLTAVAVGNAVITCTTSDGGKKAVCNVTVSPPDENNLLQSKHIPDPVFLEYCRQQMGTWDKGNKDGKLYADEAAAVTSIDVANIYGTSISSLRGIEYFTGITYLDCTLNNLTSLDLSSNSSLRELYCYNNARLSSLVLSGYTALTILDCSGCMLTSLDLSRCTRLVELTCHHNDLTSLNIASCTSLTKLDVDANELTSLDLSKNRLLRGLICDNNDLATLDLSKNTALTSLSCSGNGLAKLDLSANATLVELTCDMNRLAALDLTNNEQLEVLVCNNNEIASVAVDKEGKLRNIHLQSNRMSAVGLNDLFAALPPSGAIAISGNPGTAACDKSIAGNSNWTVKAD